MDLAADPGQMLMIWTAEPGSKSAQAFRLLGSWAATPQQPELQDAQTILDSPSSRWTIRLRDLRVMSEDSDPCSAKNMAFCSPLRVRMRVRDERVTGWKAGGRSRRCQQQKALICRDLLRERRDSNPRPPA